MVQQVEIEGVAICQADQDHSLSADLLSPLRRQELQRL